MVLYVTVRQGTECLELAGRLQASCGVAYPSTRATLLRSSALRWAWWSDTATRVSFAAVGRKLKLPCCLRISLEGWKPGATVLVWASAHGGQLGFAAVAGGMAESCTLTALPCRNLAPRLAAWAGWRANPCCLSANIDPPPCFSPGRPNGGSAHTRAHDAQLGRRFSLQRGTWLACCCWAALLLAWPVFADVPCSGAGPGGRDVVPYRCGSYSTAGIPPFTHKNPCRRSVPAATTAPVRCTTPLPSIWAYTRPGGSPAFWTTSSLPPRPCPPADGCAACCCCRRRQPPRWQCTGHAAPWRVSGTRVCARRSACRFSQLRKPLPSSSLYTLAWSLPASPCPPLPCLLRSSRGRFLSSPWHPHSPCTVQTCTDPHPYLPPHLTCCSPGGGAAHLPHAATP